MIRVRLPTALLKPESLNYMKEDGIIIYKDRGEIYHVSENDVEAFVVEHPEAVEVREMDFRAWRDKLIERLTITKINESNGIDSEEEDVEILHALHKVWYNGEIIFYRLRFAGSDENVMQGELFAANLS